MTESVYNKARPEEVVPEMRAAINRARTLVDILACVVDLGDDSCVDEEEAAGSDEGAAVRLWFHRFCSLREHLAPAIVLPIRDNFLGILGGRVRRIGLPYTQKTRRTVAGGRLSRGLEGV